jgi:anaerobic ribonucleoside-triphosphate reductase activating protein
MGRTEREVSPRELRTAGFLKRSVVNGPGVRSVIWVQGCPIRCKGCFNPGLWDKNGGTVTNIDALYYEITGTEGIDGVTFSGGEPFMQAAPLAELGRRLHSRNLTVVTFSGFTYDRLLKTGCPSWQNLLSETDLLISGPYIQGLPRGHALSGSSNQEVRVLSGRINVDLSGLPADERVSEITITSAGSVAVTGFPDITLLNTFSRSNVLQG